MADVGSDAGSDRFECELRAESDGVVAIDLLAETAPLSRQKLKQAMEKGAVWLNRARGGRRRLRRAKTTLHRGDVLELHYDAFILSREVSPPQLIADRGGYSVWFKPAGMLSQGSKFADHCAITRWVEKRVQPKRAVYLVHRLDREASGLILLAHDRKTAARLSQLFSQRKILKTYRVTVDPGFDAALPLVIDEPLDGKAALTTLQSAARRTDGCELTVGIETGRKHQIRRHLAGLGWPVLGDRRYGNPDSTGPLALCAVSLAFDCPVSGARVEYELEGACAPRSA